MFRHAEGRGEINPKDHLSRVINDASVGICYKRGFFNKLLRKAVFHGSVDMVELVLTETKDTGEHTYVYVVSKAMMTMLLLKWM